MSNKIWVFYLDKNYRFKYAKKEGNNWVKFTPALYTGTNLSVRTHEMYVNANNKDTVAFVLVETYDSLHLNNWKLRIYKVYSNGQYSIEWDSHSYNLYASLGTVCTDSIYKDTTEQKYFEDGLAIFTVSPIKEITQIPLATIDEGIPIFDIPPNNSKRLFIKNDTLHILYSKNSLIYDAILKDSLIKKIFLGYGKILLAFYIRTIYIQYGHIMIQLLLKKLNLQK